MNFFIGIERSHLPLLTAKALHSQKSAVTIRCENLFDTDLSDAGLVVVYLYPDAMTRLSKELLEKLPEGCIVLSHTFRLPYWTPHITIKSNDLYRTPVYVYHMNQEARLHKGIDETVTVSNQR